MTEIMIVIIIIGILAALVFVKIANHIKTADFMDAVSHARAFQGAQKRYSLDHDIYTNDIAKLDVEQRSTKITIDCEVDGDVIVKDNDSTFTLTATAAGGLTCTGACVLEDAQLSL